MLKKIINSGVVLQRIPLVHKKEWTTDTCDHIIESLSLCRVKKSKHKTVYVVWMPEEAEQIHGDQ